MRVIIYGRKEETAQGLAESVRSLAPATEVETCTSCSLCEAKLAGAGTGEIVAVAMAADREELAGLFFFGSGSWTSRWFWFFPRTVRKPCALAIGFSRDLSDFAITASATWRRWWLGCWPG